MTTSHLIVGGYALAVHGAPRFTGDLALFAKPEAANAQRILSAGARAGSGIRRFPGILWAKRLQG